MPGNVTAVFVLPADMVVAWSAVPLAQAYFVSLTWSLSSSAADVVVMRTTNTSVRVANVSLASNYSVAVWAWHPQANSSESHVFLATRRACCRLVFVAVACDQSLLCGMLL